MAPATPFRFCVMQNSLNVEKNKAFKDLAYYSEWPKVAGAVIKALKAIWATTEMACCLRSTSS